MLFRSLNAPVLPTQMALGVVDSTGPQAIGHGGLIAGPAALAALREADVVLSVGCRWSSWLWDEHGPRVPPGAALLAINLDPLALGEPAPHALAAQADARAALTDLLAALPMVTGASPDWLPGLRQRRADDWAARTLDPVDDDTGIHPGALARRLGDLMPADALAVFDGGHTSFWSNEATPATAPRTRFHDPGMCQLGFGLPFALALQRARPGTPVWHLTGDGSFGFTLNELDTARREGLPVLTVVHHNAAWGVIRAGQQRAGFALGTDLAGTDYAAIARGFGCHGEVITRLDDLDAALARAQASGLPAVIDCRTRWVPHPCMPDFGAMNRFGSA